VPAIVGSAVRGGLEVVAAECSWTEVAMVEGDIRRVRSDYCSAEGRRIGDHEATVMVRRTQKKSADPPERVIWN